VKKREASWSAAALCRYRCTKTEMRIAVDQVSIALAKSPVQIRRPRKEAIGLNQLDEIFAGEAERFFFHPLLTLFPPV
jgi:hypothetical protein